MGYSWSSILQDWPYDDFRIDSYYNAVPNAKIRVRMTHLPSGLSVTFGEYHSKYKNMKEAALLLKEKLLVFYNQEA
jgi:protein subunit release factor A